VSIQVLPFLKPKFLEEIKPELESILGEFKDRIGSFGVGLGDLNMVDASIFIIWCMREIGRLRARIERLENPE
jgi:hypothetical protein